jgi:hypothetical protein
MMSKLVMLCLFIAARISVESPKAEAVAKLEKLKAEFDSVLDQFEDRDAAQLCVALAGKADVNLLLTKLKSNEEFITLAKEAQSAIVSKSVGNVIGYCIDKLAMMAPLARTHLSELLDPSKKMTEKEIDGILLYDKAIFLAVSGGSHSLSEKIGKLLSLIEKHKKTQEGGIDQTFEKMQESLSAKRQLNEEITDFEKKQNFTMNFTLLIIILCTVSLCCCWIRYRRPQSEPEPKKSEEYELTGTPEEQEKKSISMKKLVDTLALMDEEVLKMKEELASLKKR